MNFEFSIYFFTKDFIVQELLSSLYFIILLSVSVGLNNLFVKLFLFKYNAIWSYYSSRGEIWIAFYPKSNCIFNVSEVKLTCCQVKLRVEILKSFFFSLLIAGIIYISIKLFYVIFKSDKLKGYIVVLNLISINPNTDMDVIYAVKASGF